MTAPLTMPGGRGSNPAMDWAFVDRLRKFWQGKFIIKGIDTREDARLCLEHGIDGILVTNHGGRSTETGRATIEALPEEVAKSAIAFCLVDEAFAGDRCVQGARAAPGRGDRRPFLWGLGAFGQAGVDRVLEILQGEFKLVMGNCGTQTVANITAPSSPRPIENLVNRPPLHALLR
jgi:isopentenyl diphosphate isomerase/L-lactate dehydrogenase-like FMN-dependent dehydrogenase